MTTKQKRGGKRAGAGRKSAGLVPLNTKIDPALKPRYKALGGSEWLNATLQRWDEIQAVLERK